MQKGRYYIINVKGTANFLEFGDLYIFIYLLLI